ncbi:MAG: DoxX family protein [Flavobacteriaceae bacterium]|nr:MAG: DoxX family protein [Flavobacteriaceae bacterium]
MKYLVNLFRIIVGVIFILSGLAKTIDPIGFSFKLEEYFSPEIFNLPFLAENALMLSTFFVLLEILLGILLLLGKHKNFTLVSLLGLIVFFTFLTFYSAYFNKVTDCGCFGDALKLEPWQSFQKDLVLLIMILVLYFGRTHIRPLFSNSISTVLSTVLMSISIFIAYLGIYKMPIKDFRAYAPGKDLIKGMKSAEELGLTPPQYQVIYTMKQKGDNTEVEITDKQYMDELWWEKPRWEMVESKTRNVKISSGYEPPVKDFDINCGEEDKTQEILSKPLVFIITSYNPEKADPKGLERAKQLAQLLKQENLETYGTSPTGYDFQTQNCQMDGTTLKTINRSNPGLMILKKGVVYRKTNWQNFPKDKQELNTLLTN